MSRRPKHELIEAKISPCPKFECGVPDRAGMHKSQFFVQRNACRVRDIDAADHDVILMFLSGYHQLLQEPRANSFAAMIFVDID